MLADGCEFGDRLRPLVIFIFYRNRLRITLGLYLTIRREVLVSNLEATIAAYQFPKALEVTIESLLLLLSPFSVGVTDDYESTRIEWMILLAVKWQTAVAKAAFIAWRHGNSFALRNRLHDKIFAARLPGMIAAFRKTRKNDNLFFRFGRTDFFANVRRARSEMTAPKGFPVVFASS